MLQGAYIHFINLIYWSDVYMSFCNELRAIRISTYKNQRNFVKPLGVPYGTYTAWETGSALPRIERVKRLCYTLKTSYGIKQSVLDKLTAEYEKDKNDHNKNQTIMLDIIVHSQEIILLTIID